MQKFQWPVSCAGICLQKMCVLVCVSVCTDTVTSSVLRDSPGATYGCFYRGCIN